MKGPVGADPEEDPVPYAYSSSPHQRAGGSATEGKINFLLPDYIIRLLCAWRERESVSVKYSTSAFQQEGMQAGRREGGREGGQAGKQSDGRAGKQ